MKNQIFFIPHLLFFLILAGCANQDSRLYQWGHYENQIYQNYSNPGKFSVADQIIQLEQDIEKARAENKSVPPGYFAHLGYLYFQNNETDKALESLQTEKTLFPESAVYLDRLASQIKKERNP